MIPLLEIPEENHDQILGISSCDILREVLLAANSLKGYYALRSYWEVTTIPLKFDFDVIFPHQLMERPKNWLFWKGLIGCKQLEKKSIQDIESPLYLERDFGGRRRRRKKGDTG